MSTEETFAPTNGRITGVVLVVLALGVAVEGTVSRSSSVAPWGVCLALLVALLGWAALLRPRVRVDATAITLRNMFETVTVPLVLVDSVVVRQVLAVHVDERRYVNPAASRGRRELRRTGRGATTSTGRDSGLGLDARLLGSNDRGIDPGDGVTYAQHIEQSLRRRVADAKAGVGRTGQETEAAAAARVVRRPAWPEIAAAAVLVVAGAVLLAV